MDHSNWTADKSGNQLLNVRADGKEIEVATFSTDGNRLLTVQEGGVAKIWSIPPGRQVGEIRPESPLIGSHACPTTSAFQVFIEAVKLDLHGEMALLGLNDGTAVLFRTTDGARQSTYHHPDRPPAHKWELIRAVNFSPDGTLAAIGFFGRNVGIWSVTDGQLVALLRSDVEKRLHYPLGWGRDTLVSTVALSRDNAYVFAGHADGTASLWNLTTREVVCARRLAFF
jgi:WD40 repeat protein